VKAISSRHLFRPGSERIWQGGGAGPDVHNNRVTKVYVGLVKISNGGSHFDGLTMIAPDLTLLRK